MLKPYSSFTDDILASKFTTGLLYFHSDDLAADGLSITDRISGVKLTFSGVVLKDSGGLYAAAARTVTVTEGTMPTFQGGKLVLASIGNASSNASGVNGLPVSFGVTSGAATCGFTSSGVNYNAGVARNTGANAPSETITTVSRPACELGFFDLAAAGSNLRRICANDTDAVSNVTGQADDALALTGADVLLGSTCAIGGINGVANSRSKAIILLEFSGTYYPPVAMLANAAREMVRTQQVFAGWINAIT